MTPETSKPSFLKTPITRRQLLAGAIAPVALAVPAYAYGHTIGMDDIEVVRKTIVVAGWPPDAGPIKVGFMSDFHCDCEHALRRTYHSVDLLRREKPDVVILGGDYVTHVYRHWAANCTRALKPLIEAPLGVFCVLGNHDWWCGGNEVLARDLSRAGFNMLSNRSLPLTTSGSVWIVGLEDIFSHRASMSQALAGVPEDALKILLVHEPDYADEAPPGFALQLSGHSHGGQVRIFGEPVILPGMGRRYPQGLEMAKNHPVYTTRGIGVLGIQMRIDCRPEVSVLTLT